MGLYPRTLGDPDPMGRQRLNRPSHRGAAFLSNLDSHLGARKGTAISSGEAEKRCSLPLALWSRHLP